MLDDDGNSLLDEPETPTEKLRRLRFEAEELEAELEAQAAEKAKAKQAYNAANPEDDNHADSRESEYEQIDDLPRRDDADKTKPPPSRRRRKKAQVDENGELSPAVLLKQLKRLRGGLSALSISEREALTRASDETEAGETRAKELLAKLGKIRSSIPDEQITGSHGNGHYLHSSETTNVSQLDARLDNLEKVVGSNEADIDEVGHFTKTTSSCPS